MEKDFFSRLGMDPIAKINTQAGSAGFIRHYSHSLATLHCLICNGGLVPSGRLSGCIYWGHVFVLDANESARV